MKRVAAKFLSPKALSVKRFLTRNSMTQLIHPPYSPDLAPCDLFLLPQMKKVLNGKCFADMEEVKKKKRMEALKDITLQEFQDCFKKRRTRLDGAVHQMDSTLKEIICNA
jgi:hypothetical protein